MKRINWNYFDNTDEDEEVIRTFKVFEASSFEPRYTDNIYAIRLYGEDDEMIDDFDTEYGCDFTNFDWNEIEALLDRVSYIEVCWEF